MPQRGHIALLPLILLLLIVVVAVTFIYKKNLAPFKATQSSQKTTSTVAVKTEYQNPFDKNSQYVNPFSPYKNPFDSIKK